jgi:hypothetical protein
LPRLRARALRAPVFFSSLPRQTGRCAPPLADLSFAAYYSTPKNKQNLSNWGRPHQGLFSFHWTTEAMKYEVLCPRPAHPSFPDPFDNILGSKCNGATISPNFFRFFFFCIAFGSFLFVIPFFFFSPFQFLLILLFLSFSSYLFLVFS